MSIIIDRIVFYFFFCILVLKYVFHAWMPDGGIVYPAKQYICPESFDEVVVIVWMYGNTQLGLLLFMMFSNIQKSILIYGALSLIHIVTINLLWEHVKFKPYPPNPEVGMRPGGYLWYIEAIVYCVYLLYYLFCNFVVGDCSSSKKIK